MANLNEKINVEMENITVVLGELEKVKDKPNKTNLELAGMATYLTKLLCFLLTLCISISCVNKGKQERGEKEKEVFFSKYKKYS